MGIQQVNGVSMSLVGRVILRKFDTMIVLAEGCISWDLSYSSMMHTSEEDTQDS
jgi:hypothetical protein